MAHMTIRADRIIGTFKPLHGVNNGPVCYGSLIDVSHYYAKTEIPLVRLHDPNWPHAWEVDIHTIFPDFSKDPADPASYDFSRTDEYIRTIVATGADIVYRLGESIEHTATKYYIHPPEDYGKWAQICIGIIRHYNQGWAGGFHYGIKYWEIWNEPDKVVGPKHKMWSGTWEQFYELYAAASTAIKRFDPQLKVGGYAATSVNRDDFLNEFLTVCRDRRLPLDFFSWHVYSADPQQIVKDARFAREKLDAYGYPQAESHLNEWNYFEGDFRTIWQPGNEHIRRLVFERAKGSVGASFVATVLMLMQDLPVDAANYYDGQPTALFCGLFDYYGVPQKAYYAFEAFHELLQHPQRVHAAVSETAPGITCCCGADASGHIALLISNYNGKSGTYHIEVQGIASGSEFLLQTYVLNDKQELDLQEESTRNIASLELFIPQHTVLLLKAAPV
ncbi:hypothetical protein ACFQI7_02755 [Paenibacillus allorhizosphaerae]|uniref:Glycosyl hydrolases family 39 N-terminal catalytic domain-containing protein n=1 Tax=Paenibacillus allorhizosphaerae TaxID=2849866 RepID=A0ABM8VB47_9BACL|nr:hypothetical protein [Paenibacillus allorhizosphaerae]CAG7618385.1 hypothetical protein PAECIP111802_00513 [Paenibacillus allorhizosphaerae]